MRAADWKRLHDAEKRQQGTETRQEASERRARVQARREAARGYARTFADQQRELGHSLSRKDLLILHNLFGDEYE